MEQYAVIGLCYDCVPTGTRADPPPYAYLLLRLNTIKMRLFSKEDTLTALENKDLIINAYSRKKQNKHIIILGHNSKWAGICRNRRRDYPWVEVRDNKAKSGSNALVVIGKHKVNKDIIMSDMNATLYSANKEMFDIICNMVKVANYSTDDSMKLNHPALGCITYDLLTPDNLKGFIKDVYTEDDIKDTLIRNGKLINLYSIQTMIPEGLIDVPKGTYLDMLIDEEELPF